MDVKMVLRMTLKASYIPLCVCDFLLENLRVIKQVPPSVGKMRGTPIPDHARRGSPRRHRLGTRPQALGETESTHSYSHLWHDLKSWVRQPPPQST